MSSQTLMTATHNTRERIAHDPASCLIVVQQGKILTWLGSVIPRNKREPIE